MRSAALVLALGLLVGGCPKDKASPAPASGGESGKAKTDAKAFRLVVTPPKPVGVGEEASASVALTALGEYKVNLEYPLSLTVQGPAGATPQKAVLRAKDAKKMSEKGVLLLAKAKLGKAGEHPFKAELRFSVCTKKHCELLREQLTWVAKTR